MTTEEARELLALNSFGHPDLHHPKMETGFLGSLRPYTGLNEDNYHEVMEALQTLAPLFQVQDVIDKEVMSALWDICWQAQLLTLHPSSSVQRNKWITPEDTKRLEDWIFDISFAVSILLQNGDIEQAFAGYGGRTND